MGFVGFIRLLKACRGFAGLIRGLQGFYATLSGIYVQGSIGFMRPEDCLKFRQPIVRP